MATQGRRSNNSGGVSFEHRGGAAACRDKFHRRCAGRWVGEIITGQNVNGNPIRRKVNAATKGECEDRLEELKADLATGITKRSPARYTVRKAVEDYLAEGRADVVAKTIIKDRGTASCAGSALTCSGNCTAWPRPGARRRQLSSNC